MHQQDYNGRVRQKGLKGYIMEITTSVSQQIISEAEYLTFITSHAIENNYSVALWRLPNDNTKHLIVSKQHELLTPEKLLEDLPSGFIFAPFDKSADRIFLKADLSFSFSNQVLDNPQNPIEISAQAWLQTQRNERLHLAGKHYRLKYQPCAADKDAFIQVVEKGIAEIEKGTFEKIVPSRAKLSNIPPDFDPVLAFQRLSAANPNAFVSIVSTPQSGTWLGATPELLVCVEEKSIFRTIALAGTQAYQQGEDLKTVAWTQKDIEEHALVERYIVNSFKKIRLREFEEHGPKTVVAGNLLHLKSEFSVDMAATNFPQLGSVMLQLLHPTSAVCGVPLDTSYEFLNKNEGYDRQYYSGYLGPVNFNNCINIFVNLRCAQLLEDKAILYAGAGVTADSVPELEWKETDMKINTLLDVIGR
jgi:isochorismate synthase